MEYKIPTTSRVRQLVDAGVITIGVHIAKDGIETFARCVQPHPRLGLSTHTSMTLEDAEELLAKVATPAPKRWIEKSKTEDRQSPSSSNQSKFHGFKDISEATGFATRNLRMFLTEDGLKNFLPKDSLAPSDMDLRPKELFARACSVAESIGTPRLVSRIASRPEHLTVRGAHSLAEWWRRSDPLQRFVLLTRSKVFPNDGRGHVNVRGKWLDAMSELQCPFRNPETQVGQPEGGFSGEEEASSSADEQSSEREGVQINY